MAGRGPPRIPTPVLAARGSPLAKNRPHEPQPPERRPSCPPDLRPEARGDWRRLSRLLWDMGVLRPTHRETLARYCELLARRRKLAGFIKAFEANGECLLRDGRFEELPQVRIHDRLVVELRRLEQELGLTPAAQSRLAVDESEVKRNRSMGGGPDTDISKYFRIA